MSGEAYTLTDLASRLDLAYSTAWARVRSGLIPEADIRIGKKSYYSVALFDQIVDKLQVSAAK